jgi:4,5-DOPA dioxygenase extradiol
MSTNPTRRNLIMAAGVTTALTSLSGLAELAQAKSARPTARLPVIFIGHGSPMNAIRENGFTHRLKAWGAALPRPSAILSVSAHWLTPGSTMVNVQQRPATIHDFGGFPKELHEVEYPAPGAPEFAYAAAKLVRQGAVRATQEWGVDHGTWTVLRHMYPKADIPVFQLSIDYERAGIHHYAIGRELAALRDRGVLIMGSGNIVHNLRTLDRSAADGPNATQAWAQDFDTAVKKALDARDDKRLIDHQKLGSAAAMAVPTPDHYFPFLYALGAAGADEKARTVFDGFQSGTLGMRCLQFGG